MTRKNVEIFLLCLPHILQDFKQCPLTLLFLFFLSIFSTHFAFAAFLHRLAHLPLLASLEHVRRHFTPLGNFLFLHARIFIMYYFIFPFYIQIKNAGCNCADYLIQHLRHALHDSLQ